MTESEFRALRVGDAVEWIAPSVDGGPQQGWRGRVAHVCSTSAGTDDVGIEFDTAMLDGLDCAGSALPGRGWYIYMTHSNRTADRSAIQRPRGAGAAARGQTVRWRWRPNPVAFDGPYEVRPPDTPPDCRWIVIPPRHYRHTPRRNPAATPPASVFHASVWYGEIEDMTAAGEEFKSFKAAARWAAETLADLHGYSAEIVEITNGEGAGDGIVGRWLATVQPDGRIQWIEQH